MSLPDAADRLRAASDLDTNLVVTAGAGTGKTSLVVERLLHHLLLRGTPLERIAAVTFTRKAAAEMRERLEDALERVSTLLAASTTPILDAGKEADRVVARLDDSARQPAAERARRALECLDSAAIGTIHGIAADILRRHHHEARVDIGFTIDEDGSAFAEVFRNSFTSSSLFSRREQWRRSHQAHGCARRRS